MPIVTDIDDDVWLASHRRAGRSSSSETIDKCIAKRVRGAVVITSIDGSDIDIAALVAHARRNGMRIIGPASMGVAVDRARSVACTPPSFR